MAKCTRAKHTNIDIRGNTPVPSEVDVEVFNLSSSQPDLPSSPIFKNQLAYFKYKAAKHHNVNSTTLDNAGKLVLLDENIKD